MPNIASEIRLCAADSLTEKAFARVGSAGATDCRAKGPIAVTPASNNISCRVGRSRPGSAAAGPNAASPSA